MRYGKNSEGVYVYFVVQDAQDLFSRTVGQSKGVIYMDYEDSEKPPRLLAEDLEATVDKRTLMEAAIPFYFPRISEDSIEPAFGREDCFHAVDDCGLLNIICFGFEDFGDPGHINLLLHGNFQMEQDDNIDKINRGVSTMKEIGDWTHDEFSQKTAEYLRALNSHHVDFIMTDVMSHRITEKYYSTYISKKPWGNDNLTKLIHELGATVYDYFEPGLNGERTVCANLKTPSDAALSRLCYTSITRLFTQARDIKPAFNQNEKFSNLCWCATDCDSGKRSLFVFRLIWNGSNGRYGTHCKVDVTTVMLKDLKLEDVLRNAKASSMWHYTKDSTMFGENISYEVRKELIRLKSLERTTPTQVKSSKRWEPKMK